jgi:transcription initiation factor TFIID TATA-box-binding protein
MAPQPQENHDENGRKKFDIYVTFVQFGFQTGCSIDLHDLACKGLNVELKVTINRVVQMALRKPSITAAITETGKVCCTGAIQEHEAYMAARRVARQLQRVNPRVKFTKFRIIQVFASCPFSYKINLIKFEAYLFI